MLKRFYWILANAPLNPFYVIAALNGFTIGLLIVMLKELR